MPDLPFLLLVEAAHPLHRFVGLNPSFILKESHILGSNLDILDFRISITNTRHFSALVFSPPSGVNTHPKQSPSLGTQLWSVPHLG